MESQTNSNSEMNHKFNKQFIKKYKSFGHNKARNLKEQQQECKYQSCKTLTNFVPKILPKKSFLKPSLFVLNPNENTTKKLSQNLPEHNLLVLDNSDSDSDDNSSELKSCNDDDNLDEKNTDNTDKEIVEKDVNDNDNKENEELINNNSKQEFESYYDNNNGVINNNSISDENKSKSNSNYLTIFDVLSKNYK